MCVKHLGHCLGQRIVNRGKNSIHTLFISFLRYLVCEITLFYIFLSDTLKFLPNIARLLQALLSFKYFYKIKFTLFFWWEERYLQNILFLNIITYILQHLHILRDAHTRKLSIIIVIICRIIIRHPANVSFFPFSLSFSLLPGYVSFFSAPDQIYVYMTRV